MPDWYRLDLPLAECCRNGKADQLQNAFQAIFITSGRPKDAALFKLHDDSCETNSFYVSPSGVALVKNLIDNLGGVESAAPALSERLVLLVGHASFRESLQHDEVAKRRLSQIQIRASIL
jgi:hypothetical protein